MNKYKEMYKEEIIEDIIDKYVKLELAISNSQGMANALDQKFAALRYMKNLVKTITAEDENEIEERIKDGYKRHYNIKEEEE